MLPDLQVEEAREGVNELRARLWVDPVLPFFEGHFPGRPLVPAAVQIHWMLQLAGSRGEGRLRPPTVRLAKFLKPLTPGREVSLVLRSMADRSQSGEISSQNGLHAKIFLDPPAEQ